LRASGEPSGHNDVVAGVEVLVRFDADLVEVSGERLHVVGELSVAAMGAAPRQ
jgi:hypothetical protein